MRAIERLWRQRIEVGGQACRVVVIIAFDHAYTVAEAATREKRRTCGKHVSWGDRSLAHA
ncbi:MAG: hypothetical protein NVSMB2_19390 [Chloroflexota bacterium]